jgi:hypothetical protein
MHDRERESTRWSWQLIRAMASDGFKTAAVAKARTIYLAALFRARQEASPDDVLRAAEAFAELGRGGNVQ